MKPPQRVIDRILSRITHDGDCWLWTGSLASGYGRISWQDEDEGRMLYRPTHRVLYTAMVGPIPDGLDLDHLCHNPAECHPDVASDCLHRRCCNPAHLEPVDRRANLLRGGGVTARRAAITHCPEGHEYTAENTRIDKVGRRSCGECTRRWNREYYWRNKERRREYNKAWRAARKGSSYDNA